MHRPAEDNNPSSGRPRGRPGDRINGCTWLPVEPRLSRPGLCRARCERGAGIVEGGYGRDAEGYATGCGAAGVVGAEDVW